MSNHQEEDEESEEQFIGHDLEVDSRETWDSDSALGDSDRASLSTSLSPSVTEYRYQHGRRYHAFEEGAYSLPNDDREIERLDIQHHVWRLTLNGKLHISPLPDDVQDVLDIGTGTGQWAIEFADGHPESQVLGTDLSPIQPVWTPPNCSFLIDNAEGEWFFDKKYDFIHSRMLIMGIRNWQHYFKQTWDNLKPGGWAEVKEIQFPICYAEGTVKSDSPMLVWSQHVREAAAKVGVNTMASDNFQKQLEDQGFVNIRRESVKWAVGSWPKGETEKLVGRLTLENMKQVVPAMSLALFTKHLGWSAEEVEVFLVDVRKDFEDRKKHYYWQLHIYSAQKPETVD